MATSLTPTWSRSRHSVPQNLSGNCGRPHIVYSNINNEYVLWVDESSPGFATFTSSSPTSGYVLSTGRARVGYQPLGPFKAGDFSVAVIDGTGYLVYSLLDLTTTGASIWPPFVQSLYAQQLTLDMRNTTGVAYSVKSTDNDYTDNEAESPDIFKRDDYFYMPTPAAAKKNGVTVLPNPSGPTSYMHTANLFSTAPLTGTRRASHGHQFQLLEFNPDGSVKDLDCSASKSVTFNIKPGHAASTGIAVSATDGSGEASSYSVSCNIPEFQLYQTWASSKTGNLSEVGINIGGVAPTGHLPITIFRYSNNQDFFTPRYTWETLATVSFTPAQISQALQVLRVPVNAAVRSGDRLGIALVAGGVAPLCTMFKDNGLKYDVEESTRTLFAFRINQVSFEGKDGRTPPTLVLEGKEIKWYAIVN